MSWIELIDHFIGLELFVGGLVIVLVIMQISIIQCVKAKNLYKNAYEQGLSDRDIRMKAYKEALFEEYEKELAINRQTEMILRQFFREAHGVNFLSPHDMQKITKR